MAGESTVAVLSLLRWIPGPATPFVRTHECDTP
jgi:hypothetical protein